MADQAAALRQIRDLHVPDVSGFECAECGEPQEWPCSTARIVMIAWPFPWSREGDQCPFEHAMPVPGVERRKCIGCGCAVAGKNTQDPWLSGHRHAIHYHLRISPTSTDKDAGHEGMHETQERRAS